MKHPKTPEERLAEAVHISKQLTECGLPYHDQRVEELRVALNDFATRGISYSGVLKMPEAKLALVAKLSCQRHVPSEVRVTRLRP